MGVVKRWTGESAVTALSRPSLVPRAGGWNRAPLNQPGRPDAEATAGDVAGRAPARPPAAASFLVGRTRQNEVRLVGTAARAGVAAQQRPGVERPGGGELAMIGGLLL